MTRFLPLDALRGWSIFLMILSSAIPFGVLPAWMYHAQVPPPGHVFDPTIPGITWVDLVFPFFLFTMGGAIPFALHRRIERGEPEWKIIRSLVLRGVLLASFALFDEHIRPHRLSASPDAWTWSVALFGFFLLFPMFAAFPRSWSETRGRIMRGAGWALAIAFMALVQYPDGTGFLLRRSDIIIMVLANVAVVGGVIWLATRLSPNARWGVLGILLALRLSSGADGWVRELWNGSPVPELFRFEFLKYLFIAVPGTIVGDRLVAWMRGRSSGEANTWTTMSYGFLLPGLLGTTVVAVVGLTSRWLFETLVLELVIIGALWWLVRRPGSTMEQTLRSLVLGGSYLIVLGLCLEAFEGGIKKDHSTLSYYALTAGLAMHVLAGIWIMLDVFQVRRGTRILIEGGQNPLIAYAAINNFTRPLLGLTGLGAWIGVNFPNPWAGAVFGVGVTLFTVWIAALCTRNGLLLKT
jgi:predicted acyltransferase